MGAVVVVIGIVELRSRRTAFFSSRFHRITGRIKFFRSPFPHAIIGNRSCIIARSIPSVICACQKFAHLPSARLGKHYETALAERAPSHSESHAGANLFGFDKANKTCAELFEGVKRSSGMRIAAGILFTKKVKIHCLERPR